MRRGCFIIQLTRNLVLLQKFIKHKQFRDLPIFLKFVVCGSEMKVKKNCKIRSFHKIKSYYDLKNLKINVFMSCMNVLFKIKTKSEMSSEKGPIIEQIYLSTRKL